MKRPSISTKLAIGRIVASMVKGKIRKDGRPFIVAHHITNRCMCKCKSCLWRRNDWKDVPTDVLKRFYTEARAQGFVAAAITGGEPFLRKDMGELARHIRRDCRMGLLLFTTGWLLEKRMDEILPHLNVLLLSIDSAKPERHDELRGLKGLHNKLLRGAEIAKKRYPKLKIHFNCCVQQGIEDEVDDLIQIAEDLGVHISFDVITEYRHGTEGNFSETEVGMSLKQLRQVSAYLLWRKRDGAPIVNSERYFEYFAKGRPGYRCHMPKVLMYVDGRGNLEYCLDLDHPIANLRDMPLAEIMELPRFKQLRRDAEGCSSCNSPTMIDISHTWESPRIAFSRDGIIL
ncbi:MAG: radical SAM protein [Proteobacteria bacterium]|nr:radical SAM protein [Pseudomonadota bacterium]